LAGFENRSKANIKAMKEEDKKFVQRVKNTKTVIEQFELMNNVMDDSVKASVQLDIYHGKAFNTILKMYESTNKARQTDLLAVKEAITSTKEFALATKAGASSQMAMAAGTIQSNKRMKELKIEEKEITRAEKEAYAFDEKRIKTRRILAGKQAEAEGKGRFGQMLARRRMGKAEKEKMASEQKIIKRRLIEEGAMGGVLNPKDLKPLLGLVAPIYGVFKIAKDRKKLQIKMIKFTQSLKGVIDIAFRYFMFGVVAIIGFMALIPVFFAIKDAIKPFVGDIKHYGGRLLDFGKDIFNVIKTFVNSGFDEGIKLIGPLVDTAIGLLVDLGQGLFTIGKILLFSLIDKGIEFVHKFFTDPAFREPIMERIFQVGKIILAAWFIKTLAANAIQLIGIYALPVMIWAVGLIVLYKVVEHLWKKGGELWEGIKDFFVDLLDKYLGWATTLGEKLISIVNWFKKKLSAIEETAKNPLRLLGLANGGIASGGATLVGERGPELLNLPKGSRVYNNQQTRSMLNKGSGNVVNNYITINARDTSDSELRRIADKIGNMVNSKINRTTSSRTLG